MSNMSYCRFNNTLDDLMDCYENFSDIEDLDARELRARKKMIRLCCDIAQDFCDEIGLECEFMDSEVDSEDQE